MMPQVPRSMMPQVPESNFFTKIMPKQMQPHVSVPGLDFCDGRQPEEKVQMPGNRNKFVEELLILCTAQNILYSTFTHVIH